MTICLLVKTSPPLWYHGLCCFYCCFCVHDYFFVNTCLLILAGFLKLAIYCLLCLLLLAQCNVLCNPNFIYSQLIGILVQTLLCSSFVMHKGTSSKILYFLYPLASFTLNSKTRKFILPSSRIDSLFLNHVSALLCSL